MKPSGLTRAKTTRLGVSSTVLAWAFASAAAALPQGPTIPAASGAATFATAGATLTVDQSTTRVVIDWNSFNLGAGETVNFNQPGLDAIAFNRINPASFTTINGAINAQGGVWLFSQSGLLFGPTSVVNVGSFMATIGGAQSVPGTQANPTPVQPTNPLIVSNSIVTATSASATPLLTVAPGAQIRANAGFVVLNGEMIDQGGRVTATDAVSYVAAEGMTVTYTTSAAGVRLINSGFSSRNNQGTHRIDHQGVTQAGSYVGVVVPPLSEPGYNAVINLGGTITGAGVTPNGTASVIITAAFTTPGAALQLPAGATATLDTRQAVITGANDINISADRMTLGSLTAGGAIVASGRYGVSIGPNATVRANTRNATNSTGNLTIVARQGPVITAPGSVIATGRLVGGVESRVGRLELGSNWIGEPSDLGQVSIDLSGRIDAGLAEIYSQSPLGGVMTGNGSIRFRQGVTSVAETLYMDAARYLIVDGPATLSGGLARARPWLGPTWPVFIDGDASDQADMGIGISAQDVAIAGTIRSGDGIAVQGVSATTEMRIGGADGATTVAGQELGPGLHLSNPEFQRLSADTIALVAGRDGAAVPAVRVGDLSIDSSKVNNLWIAGFNSPKIVVEGVVTPTLADRTNLYIGAALDELSNRQFTSGITGAIEISGVLGGANRFAGVSLLAHNDILIGTRAFIDAAAADPRFNAITASLRYPVANGYTFINTNSLQLAVMGRVVQQNTRRGGEFGGLTIGKAGPTGLITAPAGLRGVTFLNETWTPNYDKGPASAELFGSLGETPLGARESADLPGLVASAIASKENLSFNGCGFGGGACRPAAEPPRLETPVIPSVAELAPGDEGPAANERVINSVPLAFAAKDEDEEKSEQEEPLAGSGNPDLWPISPRGLR